MKRVEMSVIETEEQGEKLVVPGGWKARVIEVAPEKPEDLTPYVRYFQRQGASPSTARKEALWMVQSLYDGAHVRRLRNSIRRWARMYYAEYGTLSGFDPALLQQAFVPGENFGRAGNELAWELMEEMHRDRGG